MFEDTKWVIIIRISKKDRQHNGQKTEGQTTQWPKDRRTDNTMAKRKSTKRQTGFTKHTHKTKDRVTRTPLKTGGELRCSGRQRRSCIYAVMPWRAHRQVKKKGNKCIVTFNSLIKSV